MLPPCAGIDWCHLDLGVNLLCVRSFSAMPTQGWTVSLRLWPDCQLTGHCASVDDHGAGGECSVPICCSHNSHSLFSCSADIRLELTMGMCVWVMSSQTVPLCHISHCCTRCAPQERCGICRWLCHGHSCTSHRKLHC